MKINWQDIKTIERVMNKLEDDESKEIYLYRILYSLTGDIRYIYDMAGKIAQKNLEDNIKRGEWVQETYHLYRTCDLYRFLLENHQKSDGKIAIFGAGNMGREVMYWLRCMGYRPDAFCDNDFKKEGSFIEGCPVISVDDLERGYQGSIIIIAVCDYHAEIRNQLSGLSFTQEYIYEYEPNSLASALGSEYFEDDIFAWSRNEIFVDGGAYHGETAMEFAKKCPSYERIYSFEPDSVNFTQLIDKIQGKVENVTCVNAGLWNENTTLCFDSEGDRTGASVKAGGKEEIKVVALDSILDGGSVTYIKLDVEGSERMALEGAKDTIKKYKPKLAVCIYHKPEDVISLPEYILSLVPEYKFKIRHYSTFLWETVLYAYI